MSGERWRWAPGWEGLYMVSDQGRVMSAPHVSIGRSYSGVELSPSAYSNGYLKVSLSRAGKASDAMVHRLVALAFVPNPGGKAEVNHINGDKRDNRAGNLEWVTRSENIAHAWANLPRRDYDRCIGRKLDERAAREVYEAGGTYAEIAARYGISPTMVGNIKKGISWRKVSANVD